MNICKTANNKLNALSRINHYMKQNQMEILLSSFIISHFSYCPFVWMFLLQRIILNDYESPCPLSLEEAHQVTFHQRCINSFMIEVYKYLNEN